MLHDGAACAAMPMAVPPLQAWAADVFAQRRPAQTGAVLAPVLRRGCITLMTGPRGAGKSWLALAMALAAARGGAVAGWRARKACRVVHLDAAASEALLHERLGILARGTPPATLTLVPGDAQASGLPDLATEAGRTAFDQLVTGADLVVLDGLAALVQAGRGAGSRWAGLIDWLRALRRRGMAVLLVEAAEPRALAALADIVLRIERPLDWAPEEGVRCQVRVVTSRAWTGEAGRFELRLRWHADGPAWTRIADVDHRAILAWRLKQGDYTTREIARKLAVSPATAWRLIKRGEVMPPHLRDGAELLPPEPPPRPRCSYTPRPTGEKKGPSAKRWEGEGEMTSEGGSKRADARPLTPAPSSRAADLSFDKLRMRSAVEGSPVGRRDAADPIAQSPEAMKQPPEAAPADATAHSPETVKQAPETIEEISTDDMLAVLLARRRSYRVGLPPPPDWLARFDYQTLLHALRTRLTARVLNKAMIDDDARGARPTSRAERQWRAPQAQLMRDAGIA
jgi:AAA domain